MVRKVAFDAAGVAAVRAPIDTGALRSSIHVVTKDRNGYSAAVADAAGHRPEAKFAGEEVVENELMAKVVVPIHYGIYHELGAAHTPARPFLEPAVMAQRTNFNTAITQVLQKAGETI